jgi:hypothetical protein
MGTPYFINVGDLDCTFEELREMIYEAYENSKKTGNVSNVLLSKK